MVPNANPRIIDMPAGLRDAANTLEQARTNRRLRRHNYLGNGGLADDEEQIVPLQENRKILISFIEMF